jgi:hypothetical protein
MNGAQSIYGSPTIRRPVFLFLIDQKAKISMASSVKSKAANCMLAKFAPLLSHLRLFVHWMRLISGYPEILAVAGYLRLL